MSNLDYERKYRFYIKVDHDREYHVFETRYYAQKYLDEIIRNVPFPEVEDYSIERGDDGYIIYKIRKEVL